MQLSQIFQFEKNTEAVMIGVLSDACEFVYHSRQVDTNKSPRISCKSIIGAQFQNQKLTIAEDPGFIFQCYECKMEIVVSTNRTTEKTSGAHNELLGQVRLRCSQFYVDTWQSAMLENDPASLPNLITQVKPAGNDDSESDTGNLDNTKLSIDFILVINPASLTSLN